MNQGDLQIMEINKISEYIIDVPLCIPEQVIGIWQRESLSIYISFLSKSEIMNTSNHFETMAIRQLNLLVVRDVLLEVQYLEVEK